MKKIVSILALFFICNIKAYGHPPADMTATYDTDNNSITVSLRHRTFDGNSHRISRYEVNINGEALEFNKDNQDGNTPTETLSLEEFEIPENAKITITAKCSLFGSLTRDFYFSNASLIEDDQDY
ncbi:MAG: hypothetical protein AB8G05_14585 [Oligoflexales bacterium]